MQEELNNTIKELSSSLDKYKNMIKCVKKILCVLGVLSLMASGALLYYNKNLEKTRYEIGKEFDNEVRILAEKYDMTKVDEYEDELEKILNDDKYSAVKAFRLYVVDMKEGNTSTSSKGLNSDTVYEKELKLEDEKANTSYLGYNGKDFLDKDGNIVNPDIFSEYFFYNESSMLSKVLVVVGAVSLIGCFVIRSKEK